MSSKLKPSTERTLALIARPGGACMETFVHHRVLRYSARIFELRQAGYVIGTQRCDRHDHRSAVDAYVLSAVPGQLALEAS